MHSLLSYDEKKEKCAQFREKCYQKMEKRGEDYHKSFQVHVGISWKTKSPSEPISSNLTYSGVAPEKWYISNVSEKYSPIYEGNSIKRFMILIIFIQNYIMMIMFGNMQLMRKQDYQNTILLLMKISCCF